MSDLIQKVFSTDITIEEGERAVVARISTIAVDREGDVLVPMGCNSKDFEKNPVVLLQHDAWDLPIGKCVSVKRTDDAIIAKTVFATRPESLPADEEWTPDIVYDLYKQGVMRAFSVGFMPMESRPATDRDVERYGAGCRRVFSKWAITEYSAVTIPMNQEAVTMAVGKGLITVAKAKKWLGVDVEVKAPEPIIPEPQKIIAPAKTLVYFIDRTPAPAQSVDVAGAAKNAVSKARGRIYAI